MPSQGFASAPPPHQQSRVCFPVAWLHAPAHGWTQFTKGSKKPTVSYCGSAPASPSCCGCRLKVAAVLPLARVLGGQERTALAGALPWRRSSLNGYTAVGGGRTRELFHLFDLISVDL